MPDFGAGAVGADEEGAVGRGAVVEMDFDARGGDVVGGEVFVEFDVGFETEHEDAAQDHSIGV